MSERYAIGIDVGGTVVKGVAVSEGGRVLEEGRFATGEETGAWAEGVPGYVREVEGRRGRAEWVGVAGPGIARADGRGIWWMRGKMEAIEGLDWTRHLGRERVVPVLNDAQAALLGEVWLGAARGARDAVMLTLGTGVGGAILSDGRLMKGRLGRAGHLGHVSLDPEGARDLAGTPGSLEWAIGDCSVRERSGGRFGNTREVVEAYGRGDPGAERVWRTSVRALAAAVASIVNVADPEVVVIGGGIAEAGEALFGVLAEYLDEFEWRPHGERVRVVKAELGDRAGAMGVAWWAMGYDGESIVSS